MDKRYWVYILIDEDGNRIAEDSTPTKVINKAIYEGISVLTLIHSSIHAVIREEKTTFITNDGKGIHISEDLKCRYIVNVKVFIK